MRDKLKHSMCRTCGELRFNSLAPTCAHCHGTSFHVYSERDLTVAQEFMQYVSWTFKSMSRQKLGGK